MPRVKLTAKGVDALTTDAPQEDFWDALTPGLVLRVSGTTGRKTWAVRYLSTNGTGEARKRRLKLGEYPHLSLADARDRAREALARADAGEDPAQEREDLKGGATTFAALAREVLDARATRTREKTQRGRESMLYRHVLPAWGGREASSITRREVVLLVEKVAREGAPVVANRTLSLIRLIFNDGIRRGFPGIETNPAHLVEPPTEEAGRDRFLDRSEFPAAWDAIGAERDLQTRVAFRVALLTAQRIGSVQAMRWDMIDRDVWTIPASDFKGKRPHMVPLSPQVVAVLEELREYREPGEVYTFPARAGAKRPHVANLSKALGRIRDRSGLEHFTAHDFRTTFRTWATRSEEDGGLGILPPIADAVLGHAEASLGFARYTGDRDRYLLSEKKEALEAWGAWVEAALAGVNHG
jgi:integrase